MSVNVETVTVTLQAQLGSYEAAMRRSQAVTNTSLDNIDRRFARTEQTIGNFGAVLGTLGAYLSVQQVTEYANNWTRVTRSLEANADVFGITLASVGHLNELANEARVPLDAYTKLYVRTSAAIRDYGFEAGTAEKVTSTLAKALKLGGANAGEQASVLLQFSQALQKGKLDGDEFRSVMENAGVVQELLAKRLGVTKGELISMAAAGKLKIKDLVLAMTDGADMVDRVYRGLPVTIDEAWTVLNNSITEYIGNQDKAFGISQAYAGAVAFLGRNIETTADAAFVLGTALLAAFAPAILARMWAFAAAAAAAQGPFGLILIAAAAAGAAYATFGDDIQPLPGQLANLQDTMGGLADVIRGDLAGSLDGIGGHIDTFKTDLQSLGDKADSVVSQIRDGLKGYVADIRSAAKEAGGMFGFMERTFSDIADAEAALGRRATYQANKIKWAAEDRRVNREQTAIGGGFSTNIVKGGNGGAGSTTDVNARLSAYQKEVNEMIKRTNALAVQAEVIGRNTYEIEKAASARSMLTAAEETAKKTGVAVTIEQIADIQQMADQYAQVAAKVEYLRALQSTREQIDTLRDEVALTGLYGYQLDLAAKKQELLNAAKRAGRPADLANIDALAEEYAALKQFKEVLNDVRDVSRDALKDIREGKSGVEAFAGVLNKISDKLIDMAVNGIVDAALGGVMGGAGGGGGGGILGAIFGKGFSAGGYTGGGGRSKVAGVVHSEEFVVNAQATQAHRGLLEDINAGRPSSAALSALAPAASGAPTIITVAPTFHVANGTSEGIDKLKAELVPLMQQVVRAEVPDMLSRNARLTRRK